MSLEKNIQDTLRLQDIELANAMTSLRNNPAQLSQFISQQKGALYNTVTKEHSDNFEKVYGDLVRSGDTVKNIAYYHVRNKDLDNTQESVFSNARAAADAATYDSQIAKRQFEINEWTAGNKRDTLFFMQLLFIALTITAPLLYLTRAGFVPMSVFSTISLLILLALVLTFVVRYQYTDRSRDLRFWNRRRFAQYGGPPTAPTCESVQALYSSSIAATASMADQAKSTLTDAASNAQAALSS
jgi:NADH:ubiquinone oxidoreductase subunit 3 (subunit A)